ncbi:MAG: hypothetical protein L3V56_14410, partial [Candidatus Magnetoovum sp. WYHC-5]|nr:hypothetical protein [Candidatus Magnetoovum sp. WYHC-5]
MEITELTNDSESAKGVVSDGGGDRSTNEKRSHEIVNIDVYSGHNKYNKFANIDNWSSRVSSVRCLLKEYNKYLYNALEYLEEDDIISSENEMVYYTRIIYALDEMHIENIIPNWGELKETLKVVFSSNFAKPFDKKQILTLKDVMELAENNITIPDLVLKEVKFLFDNNFNIQYPSPSKAILKKSSDACFSKSATDKHSELVSDVQYFLNEYGKHLDDALKYLEAGDLKAYED